MTADATPMFSILIATHNQVDYIGDTLESVRGQTCTDYELVIVNDGSTDGTAEFLDRWKSMWPADLGVRVTVIHSDQQGQSAAWELGFAHTRGEWVCLLDSDDTFLAHKLETVAQAVHAHPDVGLVQHPMVVMDHRGVRTGERRPKAAALSNGDLRVEMATRARTVCPGASGLIIRRRTFDQLVPFPTKGFRFAADAYVAFGAIAMAPVLALPHPLANYRMQPHGQYLKRMLDAEGLRQQVQFQETVAAHFGLTAAAQRNSFFCRNKYAAARYNKLAGQWPALLSLLRATAIDDSFTLSRKVGLLGTWAFSAVIPRFAFVRLWRAFQLRQTGWKRIDDRAHVMAER